MSKGALSKQVTHKTSNNQCPEDKALAFLRKRHVLLSFLLDFSNRNNRLLTANPHPLLVHQLAQQGYDMQALGLGPNYQNMRSPQNFGHVQHSGMQVPYSTMTNMQHGNSDSAMPKEYVGYYVGHGRLVEHMS